MVYDDAVSAQLLQLLSQLDRDGASELVISAHRPVALRVHGSYHTLTAAAVTPEQLRWLVRETPLAMVLAETHGVGEIEEHEVVGRRVRAQVIRNGDDVMIRIERSAHATAAAPPPPVAAPPPVARPAPVAAPAPVPPPVAPPPIAAYVPPPAPPPAPVPAATAAAHPAPTSGALIDEPSTITPGLAALIRSARARAATDLHVAANRAVMVRALGELVPLEPTVMRAAEVEALLLPLLGPVRRAQLESRGYVDLAVEIPGDGRLRGNVSRQQGGLKGAFRLALTRPPTLEELGLPAQLGKLTDHHQGLIVIAGPSGHGKTTTLAALVDQVNAAEPVHILTIEDPVEIEHPRKAAVISQREVGRHTLSFAAALKASLREDPDVIVIGELRDRETVEIALTAAETGHLVIATMSTPSAAKTIDRLIDMFPPDDQSQVRASLAAALRAIVAQRLLPAASGDRVVAAVELVVGVLPLATLIRDNKLFQLPNLMQRGKAYGMLRLDDSLLEHVRAGRITEEVALRAADSKKDVLAALHPDNAGASPTQTSKMKLGNLFGKKDKP